MHTLHWLAGYLFLSSQPAAVLSSVYLLKFPESLPGGVLFRTPWCWLLLQSLQFIKTGIGYILDLRYPWPCYLLQEDLVLYFLCFVHKKKNHWWLHILADTVALLLTIWQLSQNWVITEVLMSYLRPSWIYFTGQQCFSRCVFLLFLCSVLLHHRSCISFAQAFCPSTLGLFHHRCRTLSVHF